jgi:transposase
MHNEIIVKVINFLSLILPSTLAKRIICIILHAVGVPTEQIAQLTGFCTKTVKAVQKNIDDGKIDELFKIRGGGRKSKIAGVEEAIIEEINNNQYHSRQQISDMILEKYGIKLSVNAVGAFLKKMGLNA